MDNLLEQLEQWNKNDEFPGVLKPLKLSRKKSVDIN